MTSIRSWPAGSGKHGFLALLLLCTTAARAETPAGTMISNRADVRYTVDGSTRTATSNTVTLVVATRLDVTIDGRDAPTPITRGPTPVTTTVTNTGSADEAFAVDARATDGLHVDLVAIDRDGDGRYDAAADGPAVTATPALAPGEAVALVVVTTPVAAPLDGSLVVTARAQTGSGDAGTVLPGRGAAGGEAVVGRTGAVATAVLPLVADAAAPTLLKSQSIRAPDGSQAAVPGAIVTYALVATIPPGTARAPRIEDPVPDGTAFVAGSLTLDGGPLTDAADGDAGACDGRLVAIALGDPDPAATTRHTVTFQVRLP